MLIPSQACHRISENMYRFADLAGQKEVVAFVFISIFLSLYSSAKGPLAEESIVREDPKKNPRMRSKFRAALRKNSVPVSECSQDPGKGGSGIPFCVHVPTLRVDRPPPELWARAARLGSHGQQPDGYPLVKPSSAEECANRPHGAEEGRLQGGCREAQGHRAVGSK